MILCFLVLPLVFATISYAYMFSFRQALSQAASEGARAAVGAPTAGSCTAAGPFNASTCPAQHAAATAVGNALSQYSMACGSQHLTCAISAPTPTGCSANHQCVTVTVTYPYRSNPLLPLPGLGWTLPPDLSFTSVVEVS